MDVEVDFPGAGDEVTQLFNREVAHLSQFSFRILEQLDKVDAVEVQEEVEQQLPVLLRELLLALLPYVFNAYSWLCVLQVNVRQAGYHAIVIGHVL